MLMSGWWLKIELKESAASSVRKEQLLAALRSHVTIDPVTSSSCYSVDSLRVMRSNLHLLCSVL